MTIFPRVTGWVLRSVLLESCFLDSFFARLDSFSAFFSAFLASLSAFLESFFDLDYGAGAGA